MFAYIKGVLQEKMAQGNAGYQLVLDSHGFGLQLQVSQQTFAELPEIGEEAQIYTVFVIKESECILFGFASQEEKELFLLLTSVSGIGPKLALGLLGTFNPKQLCEAIVQENDKLITQAPGVGAKVAGRIILELKTKIEDWREKHVSDGEYVTSDRSDRNSGIDEEVRLILAGLGYSHSEITQTLAAVKKHPQAGSLSHDVEGLVRESLKLLGATTAAHEFH